MSNAIYIYENQRGSITFSSDSEFWLSSVDGMETDISLQTTAGAGQIGETILSQAVQAKSLTLSGSIHSNNRYLAKAKMLSVIAPLIHSTLYRIENSNRYRLYGYPTKTALVSNDAVPDFQFCFRAPYPFWCSEQQAYELAGLTPMWRTPFHMAGTKNISKFTTNMFKQIGNAGDTPLAFSIMLYADGEVKNPVIYNANLNTFIRINKTLALGERFFISTHELDKDAGNAVLFYATNGSFVNGFRYIDIGSDLDMRINFGGNILVADAAEGKANLRCTITATGGEHHSL